MVFERPWNVLTPEEHCLSYFSAAITKHSTEATQGIVYFGSQFEGFLDHGKEKCGGDSSSGWSSTSVRWLVTLRVCPETDWWLTLSPFFLFLRPWPCAVYIQTTSSSSVNLSGNALIGTQRFVCHIGNSKYSQADIHSFLLGQGFPV